MENKYFLCAKWFCRERNKFKLYGARNIGTKTEWNLYSRLWSLILWGSFGLFCIRVYRLVWNRIFKIKTIFLVSKYDFRFNETNYLKFPTWALKNKKIIFVKTILYSMLVYSLSQSYSKCPPLAARHFWAPALILYSMLVYSLSQSYSKGPPWEAKLFWAPDLTSKIAFWETVGSGAAISLLILTLCS